MIGNNPSFSVSEFVAIFNQSLEMIYPQVVIVGELSNFKVSKGRWLYFDLKDETASVRFFGSIYALPGPLENGMMCEVVGRPRLHPQFGFSVQVESIRAVGEGSLRRAQELLMKKLETEGLFAPERKRALPYPPARIGLITSAESAAISDFKKIIATRWPKLNIDLADTPVQGSGAPPAIVKALQDFNLLSNPPEVLVLIRGGGSKDDLAAFSEESVVRAVASSRIPTLVAIGHESDVSLAELASDKRASTPSNAAELLVPDINHEKVTLKNYSVRMDELLSNLFKQEREFIKEKAQTLNVVLDSIFVSSKHDLANAGILLRALDPMLPLSQGYALARTIDGKHIKSSSAAAKAKKLRLEFADGKVSATVAD